MTAKMSENWIEGIIAGGAGQMSIMGLFYDGKGVMSVSIFVVTG